MKCPNCGAEVYAGESQCKACGEAIEMTPPPGKKRLVMFAPFSCSTIKQQAWAILSKNPWGLMLVLIFLFTLTSLSISTLAILFVGLVLLLFVDVPLFLSYFRLELCLIRGAEVGSAWNAVWSLFKKNYLRTFKLGAWMTLFVSAWSLLLVIPGIMHGLSYAMAPFVSFDNPDLSPRDCIRESVRLMDGHRMDLFILLISFFWWYVLCIITLNVASLWVFPYVTMSVSAFYEELRRQERLKNQEGIIVVE